MIDPETESERLPPLYQPWVAEILGGPIPRETQTRCDRCSMWPDAKEDPSRGHIYFDPVIKCCTYIPNLRNFLVGRILSDNDPDAQPGRRTIEQRIAEALGVTPLGLRQPPVYALLYHNSESFFGRARTLCCPHYLQSQGRCGIWRHRNSTCSTWFCKHVRGKVGYDFWRDSLHDLLVAVEEDLARWCVLELQLGDDVLREVVASAEWNAGNESVTGEALDHKVNREKYARLWGEWRGHEAEFFCRCAELVNPLSWTDVLGVCGPRVRAYAQLTRQSYGRLLSEDVPQALEVGPFELVHVRNGMARINSYDCYDPLDVPRKVMDLLYHFDGQPTAIALAAIAEEHGIRLEPDLVRKMVDFGLLVPPNSAKV